MSDNRVQVDIVAENKDLRAKLAESEAQLAAVGQRGGAKAAAGIDSATHAASTFSKALRLIALPVTVVSAAVKLAGYFADADERAKAFGKTLDSIGNKFQEGVAQSAFKLRLGPVEVDEDAALASMRTALKAIDDASEAVLKNDSNTAAATFLPKSIADWLGVKGAQEVVRLAESQKERIRQAIISQIPALEEAQRRRAEELAQQDLQARIAASVGTERLHLEAELTERKRSDAVRRARGRDGPALIAIAEKQAKAENEARARAEREGVRAVEGDIAGARAKLTNSDAERIEIETQTRLAEIRMRALKAQSEAEKGLLQELAEYEIKLKKKTLDAIDAAKARQYEEDRRAAQRAQTSGFGLNGGGPPSFAGTATAMQFLTDNIASFARTQGGGR